MPKRTAQILFAVILGAVILQGANGILGVVVPLNLGLMNVSPTLIGGVATAYAVGFLLGCIRAPALIRPIGHIRAFAALAALLSVSAMLLVSSDNVYLWAVLRLVQGFCMAGLFTVIESWVTAQGVAAGKGRLLALYMICNKVGLLVGQGILASGDSLSGSFFLIACACAAFSIIPVSLAPTRGPTPQGTATLSLAELYRIAPIGVVGCVGAGLVNTPMLAFAPVYGLQNGFIATETPLLVVAAQLGTMALQWPLGLASDRIDRRYVIIIATAAAAIAPLLMVLSGVSSLPMTMLLFGLWGGFSLSIYSVSIAHASDFAKPSQLVPLVSSLMLAWAVGSIIGPGLAALAIEMMGPSGLMYYAVSISAPIGLFALWRISRRLPVPTEDREAFVNVPATSPVVGELAVESEHRVGD